MIGVVMGVPNPPEPSPSETETVCIKKLATAKSAFPSLLKSAKTTAAGRLDGIVRFVANRSPEHPAACELAVSRSEQKRRAKIKTQGITSEERFIMGVITFSSTAARVKPLKGTADHFSLSFETTSGLGDGKIIQHKV